MKAIREFIIFIFIVCLISYFTTATPQEPEINDQFEKTTTTDDLNNVTESTAISYDENEVLPKINHTLQERSPIEKRKIARKATNNITERADAEEEPPTLLNRMYALVIKPMKHLFDIPKVKSVLRNIGICVVNGAMELIAYYLPPPLIPLIASIAGTVIPFEPVVMLREKMPVTSYRRAFRTAVNSFMGTFDRFKLDDDDDDDDDRYMTRKFNRRLANYSGEKKELGRSEKNKINNYDI